MAYWDGKNKIYFKSYRCPENPNWIVEDCGCSGGTEWGGESPVDCDFCLGWGVIYRHEKSGALACYPGGQFVGKVSIK